MSVDNLENVYIVCDCEGTCRKDGHPIATTLKGPTGRCSVWITPRHLATLAASMLKRLAGNRPKPSTIMAHIARRRAAGTAQTLKGFLGQ